MRHLTLLEQRKLLDRYFLSTKEATELLDISRQRFYALVQHKKLTKIKKDGAILYFRDEVMARGNDQVYLRKKYRPYEFDQQKDGGLNKD